MGKILTEFHDWSKGCDNAWIYKNSITYASENPNVFTDAYCYLDWIAEKYGMAMPDSYTKPAYCSISKGRIDDIDQDVCRATGNADSGVGETFCSFNQTDEDGKPFDKCRLLAAEGFAYNLFQCRDQYNRSAICANNCKGVDPNAVVIGGTAILAATAIVGTASLIPAYLGFGALALAGGGATVANGLCFVGFCNVSIQFTFCYNLFTT